MAYLGSWKIDDYLCIPATTHRFSSGAAYAASSITYRIYEDDTTAEIVSDTAMTNFDSVTGLYLNKIQLLAATGFEKGKNYTVLIQATVDSVAAITVHTFQIEAETDANTLSVAPTNFSLLSIDGTGFVQLKALTHAGATIPTVTSVGSVTGSVDSVTDPVTVGTNSDKTGYGLSATALSDINTQVDTALVDIYLDHLCDATGKVVLQATQTGVTIPTVTTVGSVTGAVGSIGSGGITAASIATGAIDADALATDAVNEIVDQVYEELRADHTTAGSFGQGIASVVGAVGSVTGSVGSISGVTFPSNFNVLSIDATEGRVKIQPNSNRFAKNTAFSNFEFLMVDSTTGDPKTGLTVTATRSIDGAAFGAGTLGAVSEVGNGIYKLDIPAADLNGEIITLRFVASGAKDRLVTIVTQAV